MKRRVTLKELSKILNLSISTVSKSLNDSSEINEQTKKRVCEIALLNNYIPNLAAQNLKKQETRTIGLIIPSINSSFYSEVLHGLETKANAMNYKLLICISNESLEKEKQCVKNFIHNQVDGIIIALSKETQELKEYNHLKLLKQYNIPLVLFDRLIPTLDCDQVCIEDSLYAEKAIIDMYQTGCRNIVFLSNISGTSIYKNRQQGYILAAEKLGISTNSIEFENKFPYQQVVKLIKEKKLDGILACTEFSAIKAIRNISKAGYNIPNDVAIISFTNSLMSKNFFPSISSIDQKAFEQGQLSFEILIDRITGRSPKTMMEYKIRAEIIHRESSRKFKIKNDQSLKKLNNDKLSNKIYSNFTGKNMGRFEITH